MLETPERWTDEDTARLGERLSAPGERPPEPDAEAEATEPGLEDELDRPISAGLASLASLLSTSAAALVVGGLFLGAGARLAAVGAAIAGAGCIWISSRVRYPALFQLLTLPLVLAAGAAAALAGTRGAGLPDLVSEVIRNGGLAQPPVAFDPGWRFLIVVAFAVLGAGAAALASGFNRPQLAVFLPVPVFLWSLLGESSQFSAVPTIAAIALLVAALTVAFGAQLGQEGATTARFEVRRFARAGASLALLVVALGGLSQVGFLFPKASGPKVIPPQRLRPAPFPPDRELFVVSSDQQLPWRLAVLDVYDGRGWLTPPFDSSRFVAAPDSGRLGGAGSAEIPGSFRVTFRIADLGGHLLPDVAGTVEADHSGFDLQYDPRTQTLRLPAERAGGGIAYTVLAAPPPTARDLVQAPPPPASMKRFTWAPSPPSSVVQLLQQAPQADLFTRLQFVRQRFYEKVVAAGSGEPVDVPPQRVAELLAGRSGSPFEITAAEALLARWVGVPSRIGYGYLGGDTRPQGRLSVRPKDGATWLECYFQGYGWVPIVGIPPHAQPSLSSAPKNRNAAIRPSENLTIPILAPVELPTIQLLYVTVQYWAVRIIPALALVALLLWIYPGPVKALRGVRRRRWAGRRGPEARIRVAYAQLRDAAHDLNVGHPALTPVEFTAHTEADREHTELAWLVSRALWGDLRRDLRVEDAELAEAMARSLTTRLRLAQPWTNRLVAFASRNSLRNPYSGEVPNLWWRSRSRPPSGGLQPWRLTRRAAPLAASLVAVVLGLNSCLQGGSPPARAASVPARLVPAAMGDLIFRPEPKADRIFDHADPNSLVSQGRVFTIVKKGVVVAAVEIGAFKPKYADRQRSVRAGVVDALGGGQFELRRLGTQLVYVEQREGQQLYLWFPPRGTYYEVLIATSDFEDSAGVFANLIAYQQGQRPNQVVRQPPDPRRGFAE